MTNIAVEFLRATARDFTKGFADTLYDINSDGTKAKTEGLQRRLRNLRTRFVDGPDRLYESAEYLARKLEAYRPLIDYHRFYVLALVAFDFDKSRIMDVLYKVCPQNFAEEVREFSELADRDAKSPYPYPSPVTYQLTRQE